ncbi:unnamed protein product [Prorocentrum cordatum]|uniref:EF-hand domain-containing protein n=1 Tax=Prorocentrum cordatum TaxID=2364126 RepID=A0ABN9RQL0_9DINO|nr:unnamed protein product [Polarella glacialis]
MFSAAYSLWEGSNVSKEPERTPAGSTGAIELIEHDPIGSYDLQGLWLDSAPTTRSSTVWMKMPWSFRRFVANFDCGNSAAQQRVQKLVSSTCYEVCVMLLILANSVYLGWQVEYEAQTQKKLPMTSEVEAFFCIVFTAELAMKMYGMGCHFWTGGDAAWSYFDVFVVLLMVLEFFGNVNQQVSGLRILRVLRVVRFLRSVRQLRFFAQLRIMIRSIMFSLRPLLWASIVLMGMFYLFGLCFTQGVTDHLREHDLWEDSSTADLRRYFGTLHRCALSLFEAMSGGINWGVLFDTLSPLQLRFRFMFLFFVLFARWRIFGTANVVTGIFVEIANHWARSDSSSMEQFAAEKRTNVMSRLRDLFQDLDTGGDGRLTLEGMRHVIFNVSRGLIDRFHALDLEVTDVRTLFLLLDRDQKGHITLDDFLLGCLRLTGEAKTLDVMKLQYQCEWMMHTISTIVEAHEAQTRAASLVSQQRSGGSPTPASEAEPELTSRVGLGCRSAAEVGHGGGLTVTWCDHQMGQVTDSAVTVGCKRRSSGSKDSEVAV